jgi:indole-3-glycerol phosphate synthase
MTQVLDILANIIGHKRQEIIAAQQLVSLDEIKAQSLAMPATRDFAAAIRNKIQAKENAVIAEIKKASPSKGILRDPFDPVAIAKSYEKGGATCLSIVTDKEFFQGADSNIKQVKPISELPILRKDFIIDDYQIYQSRVLGADCILLIVAALTVEKLHYLANIAQQLGLAVLVEIHQRSELTIALELNTTLLGINNRNLRTFETKLDVTLDLLPLIPPEKIIVTESGIHTREDVILFGKNNIHAFLIGEELLRAKEPGERLQELFFMKEQELTL